MSAQTILVLNAGSSSIKASLYSAQDMDDPLYSLTVENITSEGSLMREKAADSDEQSEIIEASNFDDAASHVFDRMGHVMAEPPKAIGYRVVHGGSHFSSPTVITTNVLDTLNDLVSLDPEHMPSVLRLIAVASSYFPDSVGVACFDTSFYSELPRLAQIIAIPRKYEALGIRRYGFHGLSYTYLLDAFRKSCGEKAANGKIIMAHLGSGASVTALIDGRPVETTMGFSPASGIPMSTRSGDIDPGVVWQLHASAGLDFEEINRVLNKESGLLGVSETSADMYELLENQSNDIRSAEAVGLFCYQVKKTIGAFSAVLGGVDSIIFSGGMGEKAPRIRKQIIDGLDYLGAYLDDKNNDNNTERISSEDSRVGIHVFHTDESIVIARHVTELLNTEAD